MEYDNGGGQTGVRENPAFRAYEALWKTYLSGLDALLKLLIRRWVKPASARWSGRVQGRHRARESTAGRQCAGRMAAAGAGLLAGPGYIRAVHRDLRRAGRAPAERQERVSGGAGVLRYGHQRREDPAHRPSGAHGEKSFNRLARMFTDKRHPEVLELVKTSATPTARSASSC